MQGLDGKAVLVTGASGFIGSALLPLLKGHAREIVCVGRGPSGSRSGPGCRHIACDIRDAASLSKAFRAARPDVVIHLAGMTVPPQDGPARQAMLDVNVLGTEAVLAAAAEAETGFVLVVGSAAQYGPLPTGGRALREDDACRPSGLYGISKAAAGALSLDFGRATGLPVALALPFNVIGPGQAGHLVPATFIRQIIAAPGVGPVTIDVGDVTAQRDWVDVRDVARAVALLAALGQPGSFNICTGRALPVETLLETLRAVSARRLDWTVDPARLRPDQPSVQFGDPARIAAATGWRAEIGLIDTISDMLLAAGGQVKSAERRIA